MAPRLLFLALAACVFCFIPGVQADPGQAPDEKTGHHPVTSDLPVDAIPDMDEDIEKGLPIKKERNWVVVPIPISSPTFGTGLIAGGAYFYPQSPEQKAVQPASFTGAAAAYTSNESWFAGVMQQNYWSGDDWRMNGFAGYLDFKLELVPPPEEGGDSLLDWNVRGAVVQANVFRRISGDWYFGLMGRYLDIEQSLSLGEDDPDFNFSEDITSPGIGLLLEFDTRDEPSNAYSGRRFELKAIAADQSQEDDGRYESYFARFRSYHLLKPNLVLALDLHGCTKSGTIPLWDTCRLNLRGFPATEYLASDSLSAQAELRWRAWKRWGLVAFGGAGRVNGSLGGYGEDETIPSYGVGLRFMVLESQRINMRLDYARSSNGNSAIYLSATEAF